jgi:dTDP-4-dehydrorhamnose 3,5-epimerase
MTGPGNIPNVTLGAIDGVELWKMPVFSDLRGRLFKAYVAGDAGSFSNQFSTYEHFFTESHRSVFRGMHFQGAPHAVTKIISLVHGATIDFLFDMREESRTFGFLQIQAMDAVNPLSLLIPPGVAHGYLVLEEKTLISYRMNGPFCGNCDSGVSADLVAEYLPMSLTETIRSARDLALPAFGQHHYESECSL